MDDGHIWGELLIIILLVLANGACSLAEIAIVGARKTKLSRDSVRNYCRWHHLAGYGRAVAAAFREEKAREDIGYGMESPAHRPAEACGI